ncbi:hypothetical protein Tco_0898040 [Tanacetum coccineum]
MIADIKGLTSWTQLIANAQTLPANQRSLKRLLVSFTHGGLQDITSRLSHSELVDIEKVAVCSSLRSLKPKCTIESRATPRDILNLIRTLVKIMLSNLHNVNNIDGNPALSKTSNKLMVDPYGFEGLGHGGNYKGKKIVKEKEPNDEWVNPTSDDNIILGNYVKKCISDGSIWYKMGYSLPYKLDENEHPHNVTCQCCKKGIKVQNDLKEFHEEMKEIHYSLNNNFKLLCSMVEPLAKAAAQRRKK